MVGLQAVSSRPDVTPPDYLKELEKLQDQIPAFDTKEAMQVLEAELGCPPSNLFSTLANAPSAAASLGQVSPSLSLLMIDVHLLWVCILQRSRGIDCWVHIAHSSQHLGLPVMPGTCAVISSQN